MKDDSLYERLMEMWVKQLFDVEIDVETLMSYSHKTMIGGVYWTEASDEEENKTKYLYYYSPANNVVQCTLLAYEILRAKGGYEKVLEQTRNYFFELHKNGSWRNTYESSRIIETIMPDMLKDNMINKETTVEINGRRITNFPYSSELEAQYVSVRKIGVAPVFFTAYQQTWNNAPRAESEGFDVRTFFKMNDDTVSYLTTGKEAELNVWVKTEADAGYVIIEVPLPAGCSYNEFGSNNQRYPNEIHREYYKDRVSIFCSELKKGIHCFTVNLLPRFSGRYHLNPTRAELMYFPSFYGRESMKTIDIK